MRVSIFGPPYWQDHYLVLNCNLESVVELGYYCYDLESVLSKRYTLVLSNKRELDKVPPTD